MRRLTQFAAAALLLWEAPNGLAEAEVSAPVVVETVTSGDFAIEIDTVGHVQALRSVLIQTQVSGQLMSVSFREGQPVTKGQVLAQIDPRALQATVVQDAANEAQDKASYDNARAVLTRSVPLLAKGLVSAEDVQTDRAQVAELQARVAADAAALSRDQVQLGYATIVSPMDGIAGLLAIDPGSIITSGEPHGLVSIVQIEPIAVVFPLVSAELPSVQKAIAQDQTSALAVLAVSQSGSEILDTGRLAVVNNQVDLASGTVTLKAMFSNQARRLWPGELINVKLLLKRETNVISIPLDAVERGPQGAFVWTLAPDGSAQQTDVTTTMSSGGRALIGSGLKPGDRIVTDGQYGLVAGSHTRILPAGHVPPDEPTLRNTGDDQLGISP